HLQRLCAGKQVICFSFCFSSLVVLSQSCLLASSHGDVESDAQWLSVLERRADLAISLNPLSSGYSQDVTGQVRISPEEMSISLCLLAQMSVLRSDHLLPSTAATYHYKTA